MVVESFWRAVTTKRSILFYFFFLTLLLSFLVSQSCFVSATTITDLSLSTNGHPMRWISNHQQLVTLHFTIDEEQGFAYLDLSELETDPGLASAHSNERFDLSLCTPQGTPNTVQNTTSNSTSNESQSLCSEELVVQLTNSTVMIPYRLFIGGQNFYGNRTLKFSIDNSSPIVTSIKTSLCKENPPRCFVGNNIPTNITVMIDDAVGSFNNHLIFYKLGSRIFAVNNCSENTCTGEARINCVDNARLDLFVTDANGVQSQDDAGNPVTNPGEITRVICDASPPKIEGIDVVGDDLGLVTNKGSFKVIAKIHETVGTVQMDANLSELNLSSQQTTCVRGGGDTQTCTLTVSNPLAGRNKKIPLIFTDDLGLTASAEVKIPMILAVANETNQTIDFFDVKATSVNPRTNNRAALQLAMDNNFDYPYFIRYSFTQNEPGTKILKQELDGTNCQMVKKPKNPQNPFGPNENENWSQTPALFNDFSVFYPNADWNVQNRLDTSFLDIDTSKLPRDVLLVKCNLSLTVQKDGVFYPTPEMETIYFPVKFYNSKLGTPGKAFLKKMDDERDKLNGGLSKLIGLANKVFSTFADLCQMQQLLIMLNTPGLQMEAIGLMMMQLGPGAGLAQAGSGATSAVLSTSLTYWAGAIPQIMAHKGVSSQQDALKAKASARKFCNFVYCDVASKTDEANKKGSGLLGADANFMHGVGDETAKLDYFGDYFSDLNTPDVSNSLIMSVATQCWSGVVYNLNKYRQIDCGYLACLREQALGGASIAPCELARGVKMCRFITGEIFELPYIRVMKNLAANVNKLIQSPLILLMNKWNTVDCKGADTAPSWTGFGCHVMRTLSIQQDFQSVTKYNLLFTFPKEADLCQKALCEGKECDYKTASFLEQLVPGSSQTGDQYRIAWMKDHETKVLQKYGQAVVKDLKINDKGKTEVTWDKLKEMPSFKMYVKKGGTNSADIQEMAKQLTCNNKKCISARNIFSDHLKEGKVPITSPSQLGALNTEKGGWNVETADYTTNQRVANTMETISSIDSSVCENGASANPELCKQYHEALDQFHKDTGYAVTTDGGYCVCEEGKIDPKTHICGSCDGDEQPKEDFDKLKDTAKEKGNKAFNAKLMYGWVDALTATLYQYLKENGQTDFLFLSGWGDWGSKLSEESNKLLNPEEWQNNLCNPAGSFNNYVQDTGSVYAWQDSNYRAVLTFAGEILPFGGNKSGNRSYLYTASAVVVSPFNNNEMSVILNPGGKVLEKGITLSKGEVVNKAFSAKENNHYKDICVLFSQPFPKVGGETQYCRPLERNAYDRGGVTNKGLPDWGIDDPYENTKTNSTTGGGFTSQLFGGLGGMGGGATVTGGGSS